MEQFQGIWLMYQILSALCVWGKTYLSGSLFLLYRCLATYLLHMRKTEIYIVMSSSASEE